MEPRDPPAPVSEPYGWRLAAFDALPPLCLDTACYLAFFVLGHLVDDAGGDSLDVALVFGTYTLLYALLAPLVGRATDGPAGRRRSLLTGAALQVAIPLGLVAALTVGPDGVVAARVLDVRALCYLTVAGIALANAGLWPAFQARIGDRERDPERLARAIRVYNMGWTTGKALGFVLGGLLYTWSLAGCLYGVAGLGLTLLVLLALDPSRPAAAEPAVADAPRPSALPQAFKRGYLLSALVANLALWGAVATLAGLAPKLLGEVVALTYWQEGCVLGACLGAQGVGFVVLGDGGQWAYRRGWLLAALPLAAGGLGLLWVAEGLWLAGLAGVALGGAQAVTYAASMFYSLDYDERRGLRTGIHEANLALGGALPIAGGFLADASGALRAPLALMLVISGLAFLAVVALLRGSEAARASR